MTATNRHEKYGVAQGIDPTAYANYRTYFEEFLPTIIGELLLPDLKNLSARVEIAVSDSGDAPWYLTLENGVLVRVGHEGADPDCRYVLDLQTLLDVVAARLTPQDAFFEMRIEIEGDIERGLELSAVLEIFFERFPHKIV